MRNYPPAPTHKATEQLHSKLDRPPHITVCTSATVPVNFLPGYPGYPSKTVYNFLFIRKTGTRKKPPKNGIQLISHLKRIK